MDLEAQIKTESSQAAKLSKEANLAFATKNFAQGKALMKQAFGCWAKMPEINPAVQPR